jgi:3-hydroxyacyl-CoA dehydrogenase
VSKALGKSAVLVRDAPAFVFNRLVTRALGEVIKAVDEGTPFHVADGAVEELGLPMSPFVLLQLVGPAVALHTAQTLHEAFPDRFGASAGFAALVAAGKRGVYHGWDEQGRPQVDPEVARLWPQGDAPLSAEQVLDRARLALAEEIAIMLADGVVAGPQDIDLCLILGGGWAFWNGGITPYLDRTGVSERANGRRFLPPGAASVPRQAHDEP